MAPRFDYTCMGFITFDALCRPVTEIAPGGGTYFVEDFTLAVSGAAGSACFVGAKHGLKVQAVGGVGEDDMGEWVRMKMTRAGIDTGLLKSCPGVTTSSSIVTTRPDGARPALHKRGATDAFYIADHEVDRLLDTRLLHVGGAGLMRAMDDCGRTREIMAEARARGVITTLDVFASTAEDLPKVAALLPYTDYFLPSEEEAGALSGLSAPQDQARFLLDKGAACVILTLGAQGASYHHSDGTEVRRSAFNIRAVCTCGCGDCFNAGFATGLLTGMDPIAAIDLAQAVSAQTAMGLGSQAGVVDLETSLRFLRDTPRRS